MLENAIRGISFEADESIVSKIIDLSTTNGMDRIINLISILDDLSKKQTKRIASNTFHNVVSKKN